MHSLLKLPEAEAHLCTKHLERAVALVEKLKTAAKALEAAVLVGHALLLKSKTVVCKSEEGLLVHKVCGFFEPTMGDYTYALTLQD